MKNSIITQRAKELRQQSTNAEKLLWRHLRAKQMKGTKFRRQQPPLVGGARGGGAEDSDPSANSDTLSPSPNSSHQGRGTRSAGLKRLIVVILALFLPCAFSSASDWADPQPLMARVSISPDEAIYVGQRVELSVTVLTDQWFGKAPILPEFEVPDTITLKPVNATINSSERIKGQSYAAQTQPYFIYPRQAGRFTIPPLTIRVVVGREKEEQTITTYEVSFEASIPEAAIEAGVRELIATPKLEVKESFDKQAEGLKVGDSLTRTINMTLSDSLAMLLPPLSFEPIEGLGVYPAQPQTEDKAERGSYTGTRLESVTYVMEAAGSYQLPEISISWWDTKQGKLKQEILPAVELTVEENPALAEEQLGGDRFEEESEASAQGLLDIRLEQVALLLAAILAIVAFANVQPIRRLLLPWINKKRTEYLLSEAGMLAAFRKACMQNDERAAMNLLMRWLDSYGPERPIGILERYVEGVDEPEFARQTERLLHTLYRELEERGWQGKGLHYSLHQVRKKSLTQGRAAGMMPNEPQLALNPEGRKSERTMEVFRNTR